MAELLIDQDIPPIEEFLAAEQAKDLLRFSTAGSVDDGKSTLIGRLLYDSHSLYEDHVRSVTRFQGARAAIDFAQLTDGLRAEREQGITIDVAYRYFSTARRKFIIADTPGHEQYTRNMATGASTADLAIILIDARKGILTQSRRHAYIASLLGIPRVVAAVNKMDLVGYSEEVFARLENDLVELAAKVGLKDVFCIPVSALEGDNVVVGSGRMDWYDGPALLEYLETVPLHTEVGLTGFRMAVQRVIRPDQHYRGFAGQIAAGTVWPGDRVVALPSGQTSRVKSITTFDGDLDSATAPLSVAITLEDEIDVSRGDMIAAAHDRPETASHFEASAVWLDAEPLNLEKEYLLKHTTQTVKARMRVVRERVDLQTLHTGPAATLEMNAIGVLEIETNRPLFVDAYGESRATGCFILIDAETNATVCAGMVRRPHVQSGAKLAEKPVVLALRSPQVIAALERELLAQGRVVVRTRVQRREIWRELLKIGATTLVETDENKTADFLIADESGDLEPVIETLDPDVELGVGAIVGVLRSREILGREQ